MGLGPVREANDDRVIVYEIVLPKILNALIGCVEWIHGSMNRKWEELEVGEDSETLRQAHLSCSVQPQSHFSQFHSALGSSTPGVAQTVALSQAPRAAVDSEPHGRH